MQKILLVFGLIFFSWGIALGQNREITGVVTDKSDGTSIPGVNVLVKGTAIGTATDNDGKFVIQAPSSATTLVISFVGYVTQEVDVTTPPAAGPGARSSLSGNLASAAPPSRRARNRPEAPRTSYRSAERRRPQSTRLRRAASITDFYVCS